MKLRMDPLGFIFLAAILSMLGGFINDTNDEPKEPTHETR